ncbi:MAG: glycosyltransferase family 4 protein [Pseudomonadota bacterium]
MAPNKHFLLVRHLVTQSASRAWLDLPLSLRSRHQIKNFLFRNLPFIFRRFKSYQNWQEDSAPFDSTSPNNPHYVFIDHDGDSKIPLGDPAHRIVVVSHDARAHGAEFLALGMVKTLKQELNLNVEAVLLGGGRLTSEFASLAPVHVFNEFEARMADFKKLAQSLAQRGFTKAIVNTTASGRIVPVFRDAGIESVCLVHELPGIIRSYRLETQARQIASSASAVVFPARIVADGFAQFAQVDTAKQVIRPQGLYRKNKWRMAKDAARAELRKQLGMPPDTKIVLAVGFADFRKGADLFVDCATKILMDRSDIDFVWVGHSDPKMQNIIEGKLMNSPFRDRIHFVGYVPDTALFHAGSDVYALTSREDPFPNVVLESFDVGVPVVAFASTGGAANLVEEVGGIVVPSLDAEELSSAICRLFDTPDLHAALSKAVQDKVDQNFSFREYLTALCDMLGAKIPKVA